MYNESLLEKIEFLGFVVDRDHIKDAVHWPPILESPTSKIGWSRGLHTFNAEPAYRYLFMAAENKHRIKVAAPVIGMLETEKGLVDAMNVWAPKGARFRSVWLFMIDEKLGERLGKILSAHNNNVPPKVLLHEAV